MSDNLKKRVEKHHIIPKSRGGRDSDGVAYIDELHHLKYHQLFDNKTPVEILDWLVSYFWAGNASYIIDYMSGKKR